LEPFIEGMRHKLAETWLCFLNSCILQYNQQLFSSQSVWSPADMLSPIGHEWLQKAMWIARLLSSLVQLVMLFIVVVSPVSASYMMSTCNVLSNMSRSTNCLTVIWSLHLSLS
jgi:hypothetical protein